jgi:DNA-binding transcriptional regulator PaaX
MNVILPEGKVQITASANLKDRIDGIQFTSQGYEVWITKVVNEKDQEEQARILNNTAEELVQRYFGKLSKEITETRNDLVDNLRIDLEKKYADRLKKGKEMVLSLQEENKELKRIVKDLQRLN